MRRTDEELESIRSQLKHNPLTGPGIIYQPEHIGYNRKGKITVTFTEKRVPKEYAGAC